MTVTKQVSLHGRRAFLTDDNQLAAKEGFVAGGPVGEPAIYFPSPNLAALFDDFLGDVVADEWNAVEGDTGMAQAIQAGTGGVYRLIGTNTPTPAPGGVNQLTQELNWKADMGSAGDGMVYMAARVKVESVSRTQNRQHVFVGFTDNKAAEMPIYDTGAGVITQAADAVGIMFSPGGDTGWSAVAAKSTAGDSGDATPVSLETSVTANKWVDLAVRLKRSTGDTGGTAYFYVDGALKGLIGSPVNSSVAMTPTIAYFSQDTGARFLDIDYVNVAGTRDTGL